jgi:hypothetical protein
MTPHPEFDDNTFKALEAYLKAILPYSMEQWKH